MKKIQRIVLSIILLIILSFNNIIFAYEIEEETDYIWLEETVKTSTELREKPILDSKYIVALDRKSKKIIYGKNENNKVPMASTTKIMTAIVLLENMKENGLSFDSKIEICNDAANVGGSRLGLKKGDKIDLNDLLYGLMLCSRKRCCNTDSRKHCGERRKIC